VQQGSDGTVGYMTELNVRGIHLIELPIATAARSHRSDLRISALLSVDSSREKVELRFSPGLRDYELS
jgi:hypothetical protein